MVLQRVKKKSEGCQRLHRSTSIKINSSGTFQPIDHLPQSQADLRRRHAALQTDTCHPPLPSLSPEWSSIKSERRCPLPVLWASQLIWPRFTWENPLGSTDVPCLLISRAPSAGVLSVRHPADCSQLGAPLPPPLLFFPLAKHLRRGMCQPNKCHSSPNGWRFTRMSHRRWIELNKVTQGRNVVAMFSQRHNVRQTEGLCVHSMFFGLLACKQGKTDYFFFSNI